MHTATDQCRYRGGVDDGTARPATTAFSRVGAASAFEKLPRPYLWMQCRCCESESSCLGMPAARMCSTTARQAAAATTGDASTRVRRKETKPHQCSAFGPCGCSSRCADTEQPPLCCAAKRPLDLRFVPWLLAPPPSNVSCTSKQRSSHFQLALNNTASSRLPQTALAVRSHEHLPHLQAPHRIRPSPGCRAPLRQRRHF